MKLDEVFETNLIQIS